MMIGQLRLFVIEFAAYDWKSGLRVNERDCCVLVIGRPSQVSLGLAPLRWGWRAFDFDGDKVLVPTRSAFECALVIPRICGLDAGQLHRSAAIWAGRMRNQRGVLRQHRLHRS